MGIHARWALIISIVCEKYSCHWYYSTNVILVINFSCCCSYSNVVFSLYMLSQVIFNATSLLLLLQCQIVVVGTSFIQFFIIPMIIFLSLFRCGFIAMINRISNCRHSPMKSKAIIFIVTATLHSGIYDKLLLCPCVRLIYLSCCNCYIDGEQY